MTKNNDPYLALQEHLDRQAVGFPATRSGAELKILRHIFSEKEAEIAACLSYRPEPLAAIFARAGHLVGSMEELAEILDCIARKGGIESWKKEGPRQYCNAPLVLGMYEMQLNRLTPEFIKDFNAYTRDRKFGLEFLHSGLAQMRTIPVAQSIRLQHGISTFDEVQALLEEARGPFVIMACICRSKKAMEGKACQVTQRKETCLCLGTLAQWALLCDMGREIGREEAREIIACNQKEGLVLQPTNTERVEAICSCCGCCCSMLSVHKKLPRPMDFWSTNFHAQVDTAACDGCGACVSRCQVEAVRVAEEKKAAVVDQHRCLGCGLCVPVCQKEAVTLVKNSTEIRPPQTREELHERIMASRKSRLGKIELAGKLILDTVRAQIRSSGEK